MQQQKTERKERTCSLPQPDLIAPRPHLMVLGTTDTYTDIDTHLETDPLLIPPPLTLCLAPNIMICPPTSNYSSTPHRLIDIYHARTTNPACKPPTYLNISDPYAGHSTQTPSPHALSTALPSLHAQGPRNPHLQPLIPHRHPDRRPHPSTLIHRNPHPHSLHLHLPRLPPRIPPRPNL